jgi:hypothetical protein
MFVLSDTPPGVWRTVTWTGFTESGEEVENAIEVRMLRHPRSRIAEIYAAAQAALRPAPIADDADVAAIEAATAALQRQAIVGDIDADLAFVMATADDWRGVAAASAAGKPKPLPFTAANVRRLLELPEFASGYGLAHIDFVKGEKDRRRGNLKPSPAGGRATAAAASVPQTTARAARGSKRR